MSLPSYAEELKIGDKLRDNDPRMSWRRELTITVLLPLTVIAQDWTGRTFRYQRSRIFTDGKPRKSGLSLIAKETP